MATPSPVTRERQLLLPITAPRASREQLASYLSQVDRPVSALMARERIRREDSGVFLYESRSHRILHLEVKPTLLLSAGWDGERLEVRSLECRLVGLGEWQGAVTVSLESSLTAGEGTLLGWVQVSIVSRLAWLPGGRALARLVLEHVLDRLQRRLERGLHRDLLVWLEGTGTA